jgi:hypothetical protein
MVHRGEECERGPWWADSVCGCLCGDIAGGKKGEGYPGDVGRFSLGGPTLVAVTP